MNLLSSWGLSPILVSLLMNGVLPVFIVLLFIMMVKLYPVCASKNLTILLMGSKKRHNWKILLNPRHQRCPCCETLLVSVESFHCDSCGLCVDSHCLKSANDSIKCKEMCSDSSGPMKHHFMKGNLPTNAECEICEEECNEDLRCVWCLRTVHTACKGVLSDICEFGRMRNYILPPNHVLQEKKRNRVGRIIRLWSITSPPWDKTWTPLFIVANKQSGNMIGDTILSAFRAIINPVQVIDLSEKTPSHLCQLLTALPEGAKPIVMVAGGDGTVAWILTSLHEANLKKVPPVGVIPLGTGNDLSRVLGWGAQEPEPFSAMAYIDKIQKAISLPLDRWDVTLKETSKRALRLSSAPRQLFMYNYMSIGVDALVTLDFHEARRSPFYIYSSRIINKMLYLVYGTQQVMDRKCQGLEERLDLYMDGKRMELPKLESIVLLNIPCWGAGVKLWQLGGDEEVPFEEQSMSDGKLEVMGIFSSFHVAQLQLGLSQPHRFGQASHVKIVLKAKAPVQVDGEPWSQRSCVLELKAVDRAVVLASSPNDANSLRATSTTEVNSSSIN